MNIFPHFGRDQLPPFLNLPGEHPFIRVLRKYIYIHKTGKQFARNIVAHVAD